ncbi:MAG: ATP-binding protein [Propionibacteriaceae bacterium]|nr:ATP-binding protein [Propionibacteriaceae bacterium]
MRTAQELVMWRSGAGAKSRLEVEGGLAGGDLTPVAAIYGANASGKSTVLSALDYVRSIIRRSAVMEPGVPLPTYPFLLDDSSLAEPFATEIKFRQEDRDYTYAFSLLDGVVDTEELRVNQPTGGRRATRTLFRRSRDAAGRPHIKVSPYVPGHKRSLVEATRDNTLFLSVAARDNHESLTGVYDWFRLTLSPIFTPDPRRWDECQFLTTQRANRDPAFMAWLVEFLRRADTGVGGVEFRLPDKLPPVDQLTFVQAEPDEPPIPNDPETLARLRAAVIEQQRRPKLSHLRSVGQPDLVTLPWAAESTGTMILYSMAGQIDHALSSGGVWLVDEIDSSLHPLLVRAVVSLFQSSVTNPKGAQIIFTTHDVSLLGNYGGDGFALDRDQVWFTEKNAEGATELIALSDYRPRGTADTEKSYLLGRFGGLPLLSSWPGPPPAVPSGGGR